MGHLRKNKSSQPVNWVGLDVFACKTKSQPKLSSAAPSTREIIPAKPRNPPFPCSPASFFLDFPRAPFFPGFCPLSQAPSVKTTLDASSVGASACKDQSNKAALTSVLHSLVICTKKSDMFVLSRCELTCLHKSHGPGLPCPALRSPCRNRKTTGLRSRLPLLVAAARLADPRHLACKAPNLL